MSLDLYSRARIHAALGEEHRLAIVDALRLSDHSPTDLCRLTGLDSNLLSFHLDVLAEAGLIERRQSQGDARRRYVTLRWEALAATGRPVGLSEGHVLFVCSRNAARSQLAAAMWRDHGDASSAGTDPAGEVDPLARVVAEAHGLDLADARPRGYDEVEVSPALVVSVCDRARESGLPWTVPQLHWSIPDPAGGDREDYEAAFSALRRRVDHLADAMSGRAA